MVEMAICFLGFMLLTIGSMECGWAVYAYNFCSYAAQDAARWASVNGSLSSSPATQATVAAYVKAEAVGLDTSVLSTTATWTPNNSPGSTVEITVTYRVNPMAGLALKQSFNVSSTADVVINH